MLTDSRSLPQRSTYLQQVSGSAQPGQRLRVVLGAPGQRPYMAYCPVLEASPGRRLAWAAVILNAA